MATGIEMLMKSFGIDPQKIVGEFKGQFDQLEEHVKRELAAIHAGIDRIEKRQEEQWTKIQTALSMTSQVRVVQPNPPQPLPVEQQPLLAEHN